MGKPNPVSPTKPEAAHGSLSFFQPKPGGPISPHAGPVFSPHGPHHSPASPCAQRQSRFGPRDAQPASARPRLTPLTSWPHLPEPSPSSAQDPRRDAAPLLRARPPSKRFPPEPRDRATTIAGIRFHRRIAPVISALRQRRSRTPRCSGWL